MILDPERRAVTDGEHVAKMSKAQWEIMLLLLKRPGEMISYDRLFNALWGLDPNGGPLNSHNCLKVHICHLNRKMKAAGFSKTNPIQCVHEWGYRVEIYSKPYPRFNREMA